MHVEFWEQRYAESGHAYGTAPNVYLTTHAAMFKPGQRVLVIGDGEGRNGVWLAQQRLDVTSVDYSATGLRKAQALARERQVSLTTHCVDLTQWDWPQREFDFVVIIYVHFSPEVRARMHQAALQALKPGGQIILEAFTFEQLEHESGGPPVREMLYDASLLKEDFYQGEILELTECRAVLDEGKYHVGEAAIVRARIRRPAA
jgi:cyclopropane fatty-acyl-phospholipid synthase-like methyltransferase